MEVIWLEWEEEYLLRRDWTTRITLIRLNKLAVARKSEEWLARLATASPIIVAISF